MKKSVICILLAVLLLFGGCSFHFSFHAGTPETTAPAETQSLQPEDLQPAQFSDDPDIAATWVNGGTYTDGQDYVETMTLLPDGAAMITIEYQDSFQTLTGTYTALNGTLTVRIDADPPYDRVYQYERDANVLTLHSEDKTVTYRRSD